MTGVLTRRGDEDTDTHRTEDYVKTQGADVTFESRRGSGETTTL
jgi:hypothetical protein